MSAQSPPKHPIGGESASTPSAGPSKLAREITIDSEDTQMQDHIQNGMSNGETSGSDLTIPSSQPERSMDLITELESTLTLLIMIMSHSIGILCFKSAHVQISENIPLFLPQSLQQHHAFNQLLQPNLVEAEIEELTDDLVGKSKEMEKLIEKLPKQSNDELVKKEIQEIDDEMKSVNQDFKNALKEAEQLRQEMDDLLRQLCNDHQQGRAKLAAAAAAATAPTHSSSQIAKSFT